MRVAVCRKLGTATHGVWSIFVSRDQLVRIGCYTDASDDQKQGGSSEEPSEHLAFFLIDAKVHQHCNGIYEYDDRKVVCDLNMVGLDLHAERHGEKNGSQYGLRQPLGGR